MYVRFTLLLLLASAVQQGLADSGPSSKDVGYSSDVKNVPETATVAAPRFSLTKGVEECKKVMHKVLTGLWNFFRYIWQFKEDAVRAYNEYKQCETAIDENAVLVCKASVRKEYLDSVGINSRYVYESIKYAFLNSFKLPFCLLP